MNRRICILSTSFAGGGAERVAANLANDFSARGIAVDLVLLQSHGPYRDLIVPSVRVIDLNAARVRYSIPALRRYFKKTAPAKVLSVVRDTNLVAAIAAQGLESAPEFYFREANTFEDLGLMPFWKASLLRIGMRMLYGRSRLMIANSQATRRDILAIGIPNLRVVVIHNPVIGVEFGSRVGESIRHPWLDNPGLQVVIGAGRLDVQKDFSALIQSFRLVQAERANTRLIILGDGAEESNLRRLIHDLGLVDVVELTGFVANPYPYFAKADVLASTSRWEGFGNVIVEALAVGTAVVATNCPGGPSEILANGKFGDVVPVGDHEAMADAILKNLRSPPPAELLRQRAGAFATARIGEKYAETMGIVRNGY